MGAFTESLIDHKSDSWMTQFKSNEWAKLSPEERLNLLQEAEDRVAKEEHRLSRRIVPEKMEGKHEGWDGYYSRKDPGNIYINEEFINNTNLDGKCHFPGYTAIRALQTVYHEGRHAFQDDCIQNRCAVIDGKIKTDVLLKDLAKKNGIINDEIIELWEMQLRVYFDGENDLPDAFLCYYFQPNEDDAEGFAVRKINEVAKQLDDLYFSKLASRESSLRAVKESTADLLWKGSDFREQIAQEVRDKYNRIEKMVASVQAVHSAPAKKQSHPPVLNTEKRKFSLIQYAILGGTLLWLLLMYWIAAPSGLLQHLLWFVSAAIPFVPVVLLLRVFPALRNKKGGILLLVLFAVLLLLIQKLYFWLSIAYLIAGTISLFKGISSILPDTYTVTLENADGTTTTETHILGDNPEQDIKSIDSGYISQGYTKK